MLEDHVFPRTSIAAVLALAAAVAPAGGAQEPGPQRALAIGVLQMALERDLAANRDKMVRFVRQAKEQGCRVVVFPEEALSSPLATPRAERDAAIDALRKAAAEHELYVIFCVYYRRDDRERPFNRLLVIDPQGKVIHSYDKLWYDSRFPNAPGLFAIDGIPCAAIICADRWIRSVEDLPAIAGARVLFECSHNFDNEWIEDLGWYWYVPRALRNGVFVVFANTPRQNRAEDRAGHGHSAVIGPDGHIIAAAGEEPDKLLVAHLDLERGTGAVAQARRDHPLFRPFWEVGLGILRGERTGSVRHQPLSSPPIQLKLAAAQMACSQRMDDNLARIEAMVRAAKEQAADIVVFPELAVTGARAEEIAAATQEDLERALDRLQQAARRSQVHLVCGLPWLEDGKRSNAAVVIDPAGKLLTRYAQLVVDRPELFTPGASALALWFEIKGVPAVVTIGRDALWSEIAELAALRGAQVHVHLAYDLDTSAAGQLRRKQLWANIASFRTFTATVNAASPARLPLPSAPSSGGSAIWEDLHRARSGAAGGYAPHSAVRLAEAKEDETILHASQSVQESNPQFRILTEKSNPQMTGWYAAGAKVIAMARQPGPSPEPASSDRATSSPWPPFDGKAFRGRIAWSADGNHNDPDDWAASPVALAIFAACGVKDRLVHFDYNCILPRTDPEWEKKHLESVLGAAERYGYAPSVFHDCRTDLNGALTSIVQAVNESSADDPLYFVLAGPMEVPLRGIQRSDPAKRRFTWCLSHSRWNDGFATNYTFSHTKRDVIASGVNWVQIQDQNRLLARGRFGRPSTAEDEWQPYHWMRDSGDSKVRFLWDRLRVSTRPDPSDAGMAWFLISGDEAADPAKLRGLLADKVVPAPILTRGVVRLEAENFSDLGGHELEDRNDQGASHRLNVKLARGDSGRIRTRFHEPYTAPVGRYDVDIRYLDERDRRCRFTLFVNGVALGAVRESPGQGQGWTNHTVADVEIRAGDEIAVDVQGPSGRLDYVQLNHRNSR